MQLLIPALGSSQQLGASNFEEILPVVGYLYLANNSGIA